MGLEAKKLTFDLEYQKLSTRSSKKIFLGEPLDTLLFYSFNDSSIKKLGYNKYVQSIFSIV